jgi:hypothetical protein
VIVGIHHDTWLGQAVEERKQFAEQLFRHARFAICVNYDCQY